MNADEATGTRRRPSAARQRLLDTADRLFCAHGVQAVAVDRLLAEARVTRVTFYRHFPTKEHLVEAYLRQRVERGRRSVTTILERSPDDPRAALDEIARTFVDDSTVPGLRGCEFVNAVVAAGLDHSEQAFPRFLRTWNALIDDVA